MATHYGTTAGADSYHTDRGNTAWAEAASNELRTAALVRASFALDAIYGVLYPGTKVDGRDQELGWPRTGATDAEGNAVSGVPWEIEHATYEIALRELATPGYMTPVVVSGTVKKRVRVEGAVDITYAISDDAVAKAMQPTLTLVEGLLAGLLGLARGGTPWPMVV